MRSQRPRARTTRLVTRELGDELLVYDLDRHKAYCLNQVALQVLRQCDGNTTVPDMIPRVGDALGVPVGEEAIRLALLRLQKARLLEEGAAGTLYTSRRELLRSLGRAAVVAIPVVTALSVPTSAQAASCGCRVVTGKPCVGCSVGQRCGTDCDKFCLPTPDGTLCL